MQLAFQIERGKVSNNHPSIPWSKHPCWMGQIWWMPNGKNSITKEQDWNNHFLYFYFWLYLHTNRERWKKGSAGLHSNRDRIEIRSSAEERVGKESIVAWLKLSSHMKNTMQIGFCGGVWKDNYIFPSERVNTMILLRANTRHTVKYIF